MAAKVYFWFTSQANEGQVDFLHRTAASSGGRGDRVGKAPPPGRNTRHCSLHFIDPTNGYVDLGRIRPVSATKNLPRRKQKVKTQPASTDRREKGVKAEGPPSRLVVGKWGGILRLTKYHELPNPLLGEAPHSYCLECYSAEVSQRRRTPWLRLRTPWLRLGTLVI